MATGGAHQTFSFECESPGCSLGKNGARWKSPELEAGLAMQLLMLRNENNHKQQPVHTVEAGSQKRIAEKITARQLRWEVAKMTSSSSSVCSSRTRDPVS